MTWKTGVFHSPSGLYCKGNNRVGSELCLRLRTPDNSPVEKVFLRCAPDGEEQTIVAKSLSNLTGYSCRWWEVSVTPRNPRFHYRFFLLTPSGGFWYTPAGISRSVPTDAMDFQVLLDRPESSWLDETVFYQIFPDRFAQGDPKKRVQSGGHLLDGKPVVAKNWGDLPDESQGAHEFFGGDLEGVAENLPYLQDRLGVNALYLNPIFSAPSSHKYDVASYHEVDPHLGGEAAFLKLRQATKERDIRLILDIVPNHCGVEHSWFRAAVENKEAESAEFFNFFSHPDDYEAWLGIRSLPKLNYRSQKLREWMYENPDSAMQRWLRPPYSIDGWRIDVANMLGRSGYDHLGHKVLRGMRRAVKSIDPSHYILGESFFDPSSYLQGDQLDAAMNYRGFMMPLYHWLSGRDYACLQGADWGDSHPLSTPELEEQWCRFRSSVPWAVTRHQLNLLGSHDTPRLLNFVGGDRALAAVARLLLFTYPGVPCIYYGDEIGLEGGRDPDNRRCMNWDESEWDHEYFQGWVELIHHRKTLPALLRGSYQALSTQQNTLAFLRETDCSRALVVAKRGPDSVLAIAVGDGAIPDGTVFRELFHGAQSRVIEGSLPISECFTQLWIEDRH